MVHFTAIKPLIDGVGKHKDSLTNIKGVPLLQMSSFVELITASSNEAILRQYHFRAFRGSCKVRLPTYFFLLYDD
jgi:hypothetical protein